MRLFCWSRGSFNTQPPEGGWVGKGRFYGQRWVSTHSRLKAAGIYDNVRQVKTFVSTHSRLKAAGTEFG